VDDRSEKVIATSLLNDQGIVINAHLRSKKKGSYQLISYIPAEEQV
jgi:hypothetical protein